jgi:hypothetical protein
VVSFSWLHRSSNTQLWTYLQLENILDAVKFLLVSTEVRTSAIESHGKLVSSH